MPDGSKVLSLNDVLQKDTLGCAIADEYIRWDNGRDGKKAAWAELRRYLYATDTTTTTNALLPWKNTTTTPKLTQIRDNLYANYMASMFPNPRWMKWEGNTQADETKNKTAAIKAYMSYVIDQRDFKDAIGKLVYDYIDYGNCFATVSWVDQRAEQPDSMQYGYVGPAVQRISPLDIVMNPTAPSMEAAPKIVRSIVTLGDVKEILQRLSLDEGEKEANEALFAYLREIRQRVGEFEGDIHDFDDLFQVDGFTSFQHYLTSGYAEVLTFYGDFYDIEADQFLKNHIIQVVDRHKIIRKEPNPAIYGYPVIFHTGWRTRQDNLWAMGPLDNLVGMQYRLDHIENLKADLFDLTAFPPLKIKGYVEDFTWAPFEKIVTSEEGDVDIMKVDVNPLQANFELDMLEKKMEEMAGAPKEAMGFRTPGEKTAYEVQRLENAAARIFQSKIAQFEEQILEPLLNAMLDLARRNMDATTVKVIDDDLLIQSFVDITPEDITGSGRIRPWAARHFVERAERVQSITSFFGSPVGQDPDVKMHFSGIQTAKLFEDLLDLENFKIVTPYIRITEQAEAAEVTGALQQRAMMTLQTPTGIGDDTDEAAMQAQAGGAGTPGPGQEPPVG